MARRSNKSGRNAEAGKSSTITKYNMELSKQRLEEKGFHPAVTTKSHDELLNLGGAMMQRHRHRPTRDQFFKGEGDTNRAGFVQPRHLTRALLVINKHLDAGRFDDQAAGAATENTLARLLNTAHIGGLVSEFIFANGYKSVHSVALTSTQSWAALVAGTRIWDFLAGKFCADGPALTFIAVTPEYTVGEFKDAETKDLHGLGADNSQSSWFAEAMAAETDIYVSISQLHHQLSKRCRHGPQLGALTEELVKYTRQLSDVKRIHESNQFKSSPQCQLFDPPAYFALTRLRQMMNQIYEKRATIRVLHFQKTPYLDRRILAVILRSCHYVEMIGIYDCPLIHFGDVLCLLDLIHEINSERRKKDLPLIKAFDFFPRFHGGMPYQDIRAQTYGLTWGPDSLEIVQRGFFGIILKAFMKAGAMQLDLLFTKGQAFCDFLYNVPNYTLAVVSFLDALHRYVDLQRRRNPTKNELKQTVYDLLKPVRIGLEDVENDWPRWYTGIMGNHLVFCSSCGYKMLQEFFTALSRVGRPLTRVCAGCLLQRRLDLEPDHLKGEKKHVLDSLFPRHDGLRFNKDASLGQGARGLIRLESTVSKRPSAPLVTVNDDGEEYLPHYLEPLLRDNKIHFDSLQGLPGLGELVGDGALAKKKWTQAMDRCHKLDMYSRLVRRVREESGDPKGNRGPNPSERRIDGGMPDHVDERQPPRQQGNSGQRLSHSFSSVVGLEKYLYDKGWL
ncbi:ribosomal protein [Hirsutella rhossiliensis]|uniref:Ribosomal protein L36 n=1 Tax=Hirsutella rhossiliensis TaxID=111463 RepID=A0A9P8MW29_9HYPO|nr:Ribosomal protein L36 [Hirsutella rhossiliensis]KAH0962447.1 Ribosomal protein L36 [Hirsutella rhossiliensis]